MEFSLDESPAIRALGSLFKLTEVHLWDDGSSGERDLSYFHEPDKFMNHALDNEKGDSEKINGFCFLPEDVELAKNLNDLGLPLSFHTNKEKRNGMNSKRKGIRKNNQQSPIENDNSLLDSLKVTEEACRSAMLLTSFETVEISDSLKHGIATGVDSLSNLSLERGDSMSSTACTCALTNELDNNGEVSDLGFAHSLAHSSKPGKRTAGEAETFQSTNDMVATGVCLDDGSCLTNEDANCDGREIRGETESAMDQSNDVCFEVIREADATAFSFFDNANSDVVENNHTENYVDWIAYWDDFHMRTYFYNVKTEESTWDPPPGLEHLVFGNTADDPSNMMIELAELNNDQFDFKKSCEVYTSEECINGIGSTSQQFDEVMGNFLHANVSRTSTTKRKKKIKRTKSNKEVSVSNEDRQGVLQEVTPSISKYWCQRYILFSRFDHGIKMDEEGWFSVTPELIAKHHAARCGNGAIVDFFTGVGGNAIQFAHWSKHVVAIDIDPNKIEYARHNAAIYGLDDNIDFIKGDAFSLAPKLKANKVFMSPPWGGPDYSKVKKFDINMLKPCDGQFLFNVGKGIASQIVMFLPRNVDINQLAEISLSATPPWSLEVERNYLNGRLKAVTAYFSEPSMSCQQFL